MALFFLTGCNLSYRDVVPNENELGLWEGNYIYQGNLRTKTTGENTETLVSEISYENKTYEIGDTIDYRFVNNDIFLLVDATESIETLSTRDEAFILLKYSPQNKETDICYFSSEISLLPSIYYVSSNYVILQNDDGLLKIDLSTKEIINIPLNEEYYLVEDYLIIRSNGIIQYTSLDQIEYKTIAEDNDCYYWFNIVGKNDHKYLRILASKFIETSTYYSELSFVDLETDSTHIVWPLSNNTDLSLIGDDYFVIGETKGFEYVHSSSGEREILTKYLVVNNELYKINYSNINISSEKIYTFNQEKDYTSGYVEKSGNIVFNVTWVEKGSQLFPGGVISKQYLLDLEQMVLSEYKASSSDANSNNYPQSIECGEFKYYFEEERYGDFWVSHTAYFLYRQNLTTSKIDLMQFFAFEGDIRGLRFAEGFWNYEFCFSPSYFLILSY